MSDDKLSLDEIKARIRVVCICKGIKFGKISDAVKNGCSSVEAVNKATGSGGGGCGATRCRPVIEEIVQNKGSLPSVFKAPEPKEDDDDLFF